MTSIKRWARNLKLGANSSTTQQLYANRHRTVQEYLGKFRRGRIKQVLPKEAKTITVEEALRKGIVGGTNVRKLLTSGQDKFRK